MGWGYWSAGSTGPTYTMTSQVDLTCAAGTVASVIGEDSNTTSSSTIQYYRVGGVLISSSGTTGYTLTAGTTYTLKLVANQGGTCTGSPVTFGRAQLSYVLTGAG